MAEAANPRAQARLAAAPTWAQRAEALTHILTHPSHSPSLHSQLFLASRVPCPPSGPGATTPYPPFLWPGASLLRWALASVFLPRAARLGLPPSSWRSRCPFQLPPPLVPSAAIEPPPERWGDAELTAYARRRRARRGPLRVRPPMSVAGALLTTVPSVVIVVAFVKEFLWVRPRTAPEVPLRMLDQDSGSTGITAAPSNTWAYLCMPGAPERATGTDHSRPFMSKEASSWTTSSKSIWPDKQRPWLSHLVVVLYCGLSSSAFRL